MSVERLAGIGLWIALASVGAAGQAQDERVGQGPQAPRATSIVSTYPSSARVPSRRAEMRSESGGREVVTATIEILNPDGRFGPSEETITETDVTGPTVVTRRDVFGFVGTGQRRLLETMRAERENLGDGTSRIVQNTWARDLNGRLGLRERQIQQTRSISRDVKQTDISIFRPGMDDVLQEAERVLATERQAGADLLRSETTLFTRDMNGRFKPTETRSHELRTTGPSQSVDEETIQYLDDGGKVTRVVRTVVRRSANNGQRQTVTETFFGDIGELTGSDHLLELGQRIRATTTSLPEGGGESVEEVETRDLASPNEPMRLTQRTIETARQISPGRWETVKDVLTLGVNGRFVLAVNEKRETPR